MLDQSLCMSSETVSRLLLKFIIQIPLGCRPRWRLIHVPLSKRCEIKNGFLGGVCVCVCVSVGATVFMDARSACGILYSRFNSMNLNCARQLLPGSVWCTQSDHSCPAMLLNPCLIYIIKTISFHLSDAATASKTYRSRSMRFSESVCLSAYAENIHRHGHLRSVLYIKIKREKLLGKRSKANIPFLSSRRSCCAPVRQTMLSGSPNRPHTPSMMIAWWTFQRYDYDLCTHRLRRRPAAGQNIKTDE